MSRFESGLLGTTALRALADGLGQLGGGHESTGQESVVEYRERIRFVFDEFERAAALPGPKFVFMHVLSPHPPMVFGPNGEAVNVGRFEDKSGENLEQALLDAYSDQVVYVNSRVLENIDAILRHSASPPIVVVMGDHGWAERNEEDKLSILNAILLPTHGEFLNERITPVNTFRGILSEYFGSNLVQLEDKSYFSTEEDVFEFTKIENTWSETDSE
jgi:hypothetical protein